MAYQKLAAVDLLRQLDFGSSTAEDDSLLDSARVETSVFVDLLDDKIDLVPGTKGSGKSALYRIFVDFLPSQLLKHHRVVIAHGVTKQHDNVFHAFKEHFNELSEDELLNFWCVYLISLAAERFVKNPEYKNHLKNANAEVAAFRKACESARIPDFKHAMTLKEVLGWAIQVVQSWKLKFSFKPPGDVGAIEGELFPGCTEPKRKPSKAKDILPKYAHGVKDALEAVLDRADLSLWLMIDKLDEIFPRRSQLETRALRSLLRTLRIFQGGRIRVKVFLRDDILSQIGRGFTALTHITGRASDTLRWSREQILKMVVKRICAQSRVSKFLQVDVSKLDRDTEYQQDVFNRVFPEAMWGTSRKYPTVNWIYSQVADGRGIATPRDVIYLLTKAKQHQYDEFNSNPTGETDYLIGVASLRYGVEELSKYKRTTFLEAEFPHLWPQIQRFVGSKTEYTEEALQRILGKEWRATVGDLASIGLLKLEKKADHTRTYKVPFVYRAGLELTRGKVE